MKNTVKRSFALIVAVIMFFGGMVFLFSKFVLFGGDWVTNKADNHIYSNGAIINAGSILDKNGKKLAYSKDGERLYNDDETVRIATLHTVGDTRGVIATGLHTTYCSKLTGYNLVSGVFNLKKYSRGNDLKLTIDADVCAAAYNALDGRKGAVGVYNYKTGEVICQVSAPSYDPVNVPDDLYENDEKYEGVFLNRMISGLYTPGSIFKIVTSICAIDNVSDISSKNFHCDGSHSIDGSKVVCNGVHGDICFEEAFGHSCNSAFSEIGVDLGAKKLTETAQQLGFNKPLKMGEVDVESSNFSLKKAANIDIGWASIGQYNTMVNPTHILTLMGAIAGGGKAKMPYIVDKMTAPNGSVIQKTSETNCNSIDLKPETASKIKEMMRSNVQNYYGDGLFPGLTICGKTGTAEVKGSEPNAWFVGFSADESFPYAFVVVVEDAGYGSTVAIPIANEVLQSIK